MPRVSDVIELSELKDNMIVLEYVLPYSQESRIDVLLFGNDGEEKDNIVLIEVKQWTDVKATEDDGNVVETYIGQRKRVIPHPSQQAKGYAEYLRSFIDDFNGESPLQLFSCAYCHNYTKKNGEGLFSEKYDDLMKEYPVYSKSDVLELAIKIKSLLSKGHGFEVFNRFMQSPVEPSKKLLDNVAKIISNEPVFALINEQIVAKNLIWSKIRKAQKTKEKSVVIVSGGPGTGKSVIALNILAEAALRKKKVFYGCKSKPFIEGLKHIVGEEGEKLFSNLYRFLPSKVKKDELDVVLIDEAHRIEKSSNYQYTRNIDRTDMPPIEQLIRCAKTAVFFIDDKQNVRFQETGHTRLIKEHAKKYNCSIDEVELLTQFRCMGSNNYLEWLESVLGYNDEPKTLSKSAIFDFRIFDSPTELYGEIRKKEAKKANSARLVAGYCWPWSNPKVDGALVNDVVIGAFTMPWEARDGFSLKKGIPKWYQWAYKPGGIDQVGCIYTVQGFEFEYIGVIFGKDFKYNPTTKRMEGDMLETADITLKKKPDQFENYVRNIYRVLLTRGLKGCYVYFVDKETEEFFRSKIKS
ncbi:MAG: DUF2075 domain-containing protein [Candidatus Saganbacteria bacterium]|nr:DUF2075 domain-containing protein [Candidatus Saganbacteria bacterium]